MVIMAIYNAYAEPQEVGGKLVAVVGGKADTGGQLRRQVITYHDSLAFSTPTYQLLTGSHLNETSGYARDIRCQ